MVRPPEPEKEHLLTLVLLVAPLLEILLYGVYLRLCLMAFPLAVKKGALATSAAKFRLAGNMLIFLFVTIHGAVSSSQTLIAFGYASHRHPPSEVFKRPFHGMLLIGRIAEVAMLATADILVIQRCFMIWKGRHRIIAIPTLITLGTLVVYSVNIHWGAKSADILDLNEANHLAYWPYILHCAHVILTASIYLLKIWYHLRRAQDDTIVISFHVPNTTSLLRIFMESAVIYVVAMSTTLILVAMDHPAQYIAYCCQAPLIGISLILCPLRTLGVREDANNLVTPSVLPTWRLDESKSRVSRRSRTTSGELSHSTANSS